MILAVIGRFQERQQIQFLIEHLLKPAGFDICSRWLSSPVEDAELDASTCVKWAEINYQDLSRADLVLYVSSPVSSIGRHIDFGMALALRKPIMILGERERTVYHHHPLILAVVPTAAILVPVLRGASHALALLEAEQ